MLRSPCPHMLSCLTVHFCRAELQLNQYRNYSASYNETFVLATQFYSSSIAFAGNPAVGQ